jgi:hypothetical protein
MLAASATGPSVDVAEMVFLFLISSALRGNGPMQEPREVSAFRTRILLILLILSEKEL